MLAKRSGWCGDGDPTGNKGEVFQYGKLVDFIDEGCEESNKPLNSWVRLPGLASWGVNPVSQGQQVSVVDDRIQWDPCEGGTLPSLKELGFHIFVEKRF